MSEQSIVNLTSVSFSDSLASFLNEYLLFGSCTVDYAKDLILNHKVYAVLEGRAVSATVVLYSKDPTYEIRHLAVATALRGNGVGRSLLEHLLSENEGIPMFAVGWVTPHGWEAERIFRSCGFSVSSLNNGYWANDCKDSSFCPHRTTRCNCSAMLVSRGTSDPFSFDF